MNPVIICRICRLPYPLCGNREWHAHQEAVRIANQQRRREAETRSYNPADAQDDEESARDARKRIRF